nr:2-amino-4-hydroxy-6-hydroxymethyldihydropteridine diphosphokinase [uncultured Bacillus sp.]
MEQTAFLSLGSNIGHRSGYLESAINNLEQRYPVTVVNVSSIYETDPVGYEDQDLFLNMVIQVKTDLSPFELLDACMEIEKLLGRKREIRWGPRTIDLDILLYSDENIVSERLIVPHPRLHERSFVVIPLLEICPNITLTTSHKPLCELANELSDRGGVRIWRQRSGEDVFGLFAN